jgi:hypothetical protein
MRTILERPDSTGAAWTGLDVKVCTVGRPDYVTWRPWEWASDFVSYTVDDTPEYFENPPWTAQELYPRNANLAVGECASGIIGINDPKHEGQAVRYENSHGDKAIWRR